MLGSFLNFLDRSSQTTIIGIIGIFHTETVVRRLQQDFPCEISIHTTPYCLSIRSVYNKHSFNFCLTSSVRWYSSCDSTSRSWADNSFAWINFFLSDCWQMHNSHEGLLLKPTYISLFTISAIISHTCDIKDYIKMLCALYHTSWQSCTHSFICWISLSCSWTSVTCCWQSPVSKDLPTSFPVVSLTVATCCCSWYIYHRSENRHC